MKIVQNLKANLHSENYVTISADMAIALLQCRQKQQDMKNRLSKKNHTNFLIKTRKKIRVYRTKIFKVTAAQEYSFQYYTKKQ